MKEKTKALTPKQRKANERKRKRAKGWIPLEMWIHKTQKVKAKEIEIKLRKELK